MVPAYASGNPISLLPGESRSIDLKSAVKETAAGVKVSLDGWKIVPAELTP